MIPKKDIHSYAKPSDAVVKHLDLNLKVRFEENRLEGIAEVKIERFNNADTLILDTKHLTIHEVKDAETGKQLAYEIGRFDKNLGSALQINLDTNTKLVHVKYSTSNNAEALQWLESGQTLNKKYPFLFTQSQAILARTWIPIQDSPGIRFTYSAKVTVPKGLLALMSAENPISKNETGIYSFTMPQPIPAYLMALSVGDLEFKSLGKRSGVYAEPAMVDKAAKEFADLEKMISAAEELYGEYKWGRYDLLVLPPSFPFGGMENPRLTFATPTIIVGDKSLTSLVAHELAHSWSGNLTTNATWNDFWLNEGFTVYFENRIMEKLYGKEYEEMLAFLGYQELLNEIKDLGATNPDTRLKLDLKGRNPDDGVTSIAYQKGNLFLRNIEAAVGRARWDKFLNSYFEEFQFRTIDTETFLNYLNAELIKNYKGLEEKINAKEWIYEPGLPKSHPELTSSKFEIIKKQSQNWIKTQEIKSLNTSNWSSHEWVYFINNLPEKLNSNQLEMLDESFRLSQSNNPEIQFSWYLLSIKNNYLTAYPYIKDFLTNVGRRKFVLPLFKELVKTEAGKAFAQEVYKEARPLYHFVTMNSVDQLFM
ncbi:MAG TPA: M1 family metallopeptidase [Cytophagales bacterium]|nr:M1 family metallopeptidase [Cytophagales bacterium]